MLSSEKQNEMFEDDDYNSYKKMLDIVEIMFSINNFLSIREEYLDCLDESKLNFSMSVTSEYKNTDKKRYIRDIRNAFAHNTDVSENYSISEDCKTIYIRSRNAKNFDIILPIGELDKIIEEIRTASPAPAFVITLNAEDKVLKEVDKHGLGKILLLLNQNNPQELEKILREITLARAPYLNMNTTNVGNIQRKSGVELEALVKDAQKAVDLGDDRNYELKPQQIQDFIDSIKKLLSTSNLKEQDFSNALIEAYMMYFFKKAYPISTIKNKMFDLEKMYIKQIRDNWDLSDSEIVDKKRSDVMSYFSILKNITESYQEHGNNQSEVWEDIMYYSDNNMRAKVSQSVVYAYLLDSIIPENKDDIVIGTQNIKFNKLRNTLTHRRWGSTNSSELYICDWADGKKNEYNPNFECTINCMKLLEIILNKTIKVEEQLKESDSAKKSSNDSKIDDEQSK